MQIWDLYDNNLNNTMTTVSNENQIPDGYYHLSLELWVIDKENHLLLLKNAMDYSKRYPGSWSCIGGNLFSQEREQDAVKRILKEKIGVEIIFDDKTMIKFDPIKRDPHKYAYITYIIFADINLSNINFNDNSSTDAKFLDKRELLKMCSNGEIAYYLINRINDKVINYVK